jgi:UPF0716 family protein affecting phage T7 exclusion
MLSEREQRELSVIERALAMDDPRLAQMLRSGSAPRRAVATAGLLVVAALPTIAAGFVHPALALLVGSVTVIVLTIAALVRSRPDRA